jgi:membrane protease YdiL (CAAX protease family)
MLAFLAVTFATTWLPAWMLRDLWRVEALPLSWRVLACSFLYLSVIGWQPVVAVLLVRRYLEPPQAMDAGLRPSNGKFVVLGLLMPGVAMLGASLLALALGHDAEHFQARALAAPQGGQLWSSILAVALVLSASALIYGQCLIEEVAWRGYFLVRAMECAGPWRGLLAHGLVWGVWYAPVLLLTSGGPGSLFKAAAFVVTCVLLGVLLGWLRLASRSIIPAVAANVVLTLGAGLPIVLSGSDAGARSAVYSPIGWVPLLLIACWLAFSRHRHAVVTPRPARRVLSAALH